jgi:hypothetical protein
VERRHGAHRYLFDRPAKIEIDPRQKAVGNIRCDVDPKALRLRGRAYGEKIRPRKIGGRTRDVFPIDKQINIYRLVRLSSIQCPAGRYAISKGVDKSLEGRL